MKNPSISDYFDGVAVKTLSSVDSTPSASNQHEIGTTKEMRDKFLGTSHTRYKVTYIYLEDNDQAITHLDYATHYDARKNNPNRSPEYRLYYPGNPVTEAMEAGDSLFIAKRRNKNELLFAVAKAGSAPENQILWLFDLRAPSEKFASLALDRNEQEIGFAAQLILDELGIEFEAGPVDELDQIVSQFNGKFPKTAELSLLSRTTCEAVDPLSAPDHALETWLSREEALFRRLEHQVVRERLETGFADAGSADVDGFLSFSLSVQNRRKSRMGHSFENHLSALFDAWKIRYTQNAITENRQKPDFLFPSIELYRSAPTNSPELLMLGVKSTCKDRWRQILSEAEKISEKHLATLEPRISRSQTDQMRKYGVQLVIPKTIIESYTPDQQKQIWSVLDFLEEAKKRQGGIDRPC